MNPPRIDPSLQTISVPRRLMPALLSAHTGTPATKSAAAALSAAGLVDGDELLPLVRQIIEVVTAPSLVVSVEVSREYAEPSLSTFWNSRSTAAVGRLTANGSFELALLQPGLLPFHVAQAVQLRPRRHPEFGGWVSIPKGLVSRAEDLIAAHPVEIHTEWRSAGVPDHWVDRIVAATTMRRAAWTIESRWLAAGSGPTGSQLGVLDGGHAGYWRVRPAEGRDTIIAPIGFDQLLNRIAALLPTTHLRR